MVCKTFIREFDSHPRLYHSLDLHTDQLLTQPFSNGLIRATFALNVLVIGSKLAYVEIRGIRQTGRPHDAEVLRATNLSPLCPGGK